MKGTKFENIYQKLFFQEKIKFPSTFNYFKTDVIHLSLEEFKQKKERAILKEKDSENTNDLLKNYIF
jgi:hypothetical protein